MKVITSHINLDFDGISSMVACSKLHPDAKLVFSGKLNNDVKDFFRLYKNIFPIKSANEINMKEISELIIVDTNSIHRIGKFKDIINSVDSIQIYDHHPESDNTIKNTTLKLMKPLGSCTTILIQEIQKRKIPISSFEATLFMLGIYADTHSLSFTSTTAEDIEVAAYLLRKGGKLNIISNYIQKSLNYQHDQLFLSLLLHMESIEINHYRIIISTYSQEDYIGELGYIANKMLEIKGCDAVFLVVKMEKRCYIIGRSLDDNINVSDILKKFGGGGHTKAASAVVKNGDPNIIKETLIESLSRCIKPQITAKDIMNFPVKTVFEDMTVEEVNKIMLRYGHTGMPVVRQDKMIGIISRTDIDKAMLHGLSHAPVKGFMTRDVKKINPDTSLNEINELLVTNNIGRLPVIKNDKILGIVTRTDLLRMLHGDKYPNWYKKNFQETKITDNCIEQIHRLPQDVYELIITAGKIGDSLKKNVYIVGGFVRDLLLEEKNYDIDIVIEGDGIHFAEELNKVLKGKLLIHPEFSTATIILPNENTLDIVSARREYYEYPAALPVVEKSSIWNDLFRRDFTINCMAIQINSSKFAKLIDYFGGLEDLSRKNIRVLHNMSFIEDPTRILRAIRFASRFNFLIEEETSNFIKEAIKNNMLQRVSEDRIREELIHILNDKDIGNSIQLMKLYDIFKAIHPNLVITKDTVYKIYSLESTIQEFENINSKIINKQLLIISQLLHRVPINNLTDIICKFTNHRDSISMIKTALESKEEVYKVLMQEDLNKLTLYTILSNHSIENLLFYYNDCDNSYAKHYIIYYVLNLRNIKINISGKDLLDMKIKPGPIYRKIFDETLKAKVLGEIYDPKDELSYAMKIYEQLKEEADV